MQSETERVLRNLTILSSISHNDKLNTNDDTFSIYVPTVVRGLVRFWYAEKRATNHLKIQEAVRAAIAFIQTTSQELLNEQKSSFSYQHKQILYSYGYNLKNYYFLQLNVFYTLFLHSYSLLKFLDITYSLY